MGEDADLLQSYADDVEAMKESKMERPTVVTLLSDYGLLAVPEELQGFSLHEKVREMPGKKRWAGTVLQFQLSEDNIEYLRRAFPEAQWDDKLNILGEISELQRKKRPAARTNIAYQFKTRPYADQLTAFERSRDETAYAYFMEMGTGKTKVTLDNAAWLYQCGLIDTVLIIAPNNVHRQWIEEQLPLHLPDHIETLTHIWKVGRPSSDLMKSTNKLRILAINFEGTITDLGGSVCLQFLKSGRALLVVDESHKIKNYKAKRTKAITAFGRLAAYRRILTGTPLAKGVEDFYSQFLFLDPMILGHKSFFTFRNRYCVMGGYMAKQIVNYRNMDELHQRIAPFVFEAKKSKDLPPKIYAKRYCDLTPDQARHYSSVKRELFTILDNGNIIETPLAIQKILRLQQIVCGFLPREDGGYQILDNNRPLVVDDILEEAAYAPAVIWCRFQNDVDTLAARYHDIAVPYHGGIPEKEAEENKRLWLAGKKSLFIATGDKGGTGLNLAGRSGLVIYYSNSFNSINRWQSEDRTHRIGTVQSQLVIDIVAHKTVDLPIYNNLSKKKDIARMSMNEIRAMIEKDD